MFNLAGKHGVRAAASLDTELDCQEEHFVRQEDGKIEVRSSGRNLPTFRRLQNFARRRSH